jgi:hypothetical protein
VALWYVRIETRGDDDAPVTAAAVGRFVDDLALHAGVVTGGPGYDTWSAMISVTAFGAEDAVSAAAAIVAGAAAAAGLPGWPVVRVEAIAEDELELAVDAMRSGPDR